MRYYIIFLQEGTVFATNNKSVADEYKNQEYCMVIDNKTQVRYMFEDNMEYIEEWKQ